MFCHDYLSYLVVFDGEIVTGSLQMGHLKRFHLF
jgi:hypothetical protein